MNFYFVGTIPPHEFKDLISSCSYEFLHLIKKDVVHFNNRLTMFRSLYPYAPMHYYDQGAIDEAIEEIEKEILNRLFDWTFDDGVPRTRT